MNDFMASITAMRNQIKGKSREEKAKRNQRALKRSRVSRSRSRALPKVPPASIHVNYVNPVNLSAIPSGIIVYKITNRNTKRVNYYTKETLWPLLPKNIKNNYNLMLAFPKKSLFRNPITRGPVYPRNIQRVRSK